MDTTYKVLARKLRISQTRAEVFIWERIRDRRMGCKFLRQHPIKFYCYGIQRFFIVDFYCAKRRLIIEIDGEIHAKRKEYDNLRDYWCKMRGFEILRFTNQEVLNDINEVLAKIRNAIIKL